MESSPSEEYDYNKSKAYILDLLKKMEKNKEEDYKLLPEKLDYLIKASKDLGLPFIYLILALKTKKSQKNIGNFLISFYFDEIEKPKIEKLFYIIFDAFNYIGPKDYSNSNQIEKEFLENLSNFDIIENISENSQRPEGTLVENIYSKITSTVDKYKTYIGINVHEENDLKEIQIKYDECQKELKNLKDNKSIKNIKFIMDFFNDLLNSIDFNKLYKKSNIKEEDSLEDINNNELSISHSNKSFSQSFSEHIETVPLKQRKFFIINETLSYGEDIETEFKNYYFKDNKLPSNLEKIIQNSICGMLNSKGGRIFIGITDEKVVKGIKLKYKQRDEVRLYLINLTSRFYPDCKTSKISVHYIPVKDDFQNILNNIYVIKIIIKQGDPDKLYSVSHTYYESYIRMQGMVSHLKAEVIAKEIYERITNPKKPIPDKEFEDPEPEENIGHFKKKKKHHEKKNNNSGAKLVKIEIKNISEETPIDALEAMLYDYNNIIVDKDFFKNGECSAGYGYIYTKNKELAQVLINEYNNFELYGKKIQLSIKN